MSANTVLQSGLVEKEIIYEIYHSNKSIQNQIVKIGFQPNEDGNIEFQDFCKKVEKQKDKNFYFAIDEINRANISKVFGELITFIEEDKRENEYKDIEHRKRAGEFAKSLIKKESIKLGDADEERLIYACQNILYLANQTHCMMTW